MDVADFAYELPEASIAQTPIEPRDRARLLVDRGPGAPPEHRIVADLPAFVRPGDVVVVNTTRVLPARLHLTKPTGGAVEVLLLERLPSGEWEALVRPSRRVAPGTELAAGADLRVRFGGSGPSGRGSGKWGPSGRGSGKVGTEREREPGSFSCGRRAAPTSWTCWTGMASCRCRRTSPPHWPIPSATRRCSPTDPARWRPPRPASISPRPSSTAAVPPACASRWWTWSWAWARSARSPPPRSRTTTCTPSATR